MRILRFCLSILAATAVLAACDSPSDDGRREPARLDVVSGDLQQATAGTELPDPLVVRVLDDRGRPVANQLVNFVVRAGGGSAFAGSAITDRQGEARERWTLGTVAGDTQRVEARAIDPSTGEALVFAVLRAVARPGTGRVLERVTPASTGGIAGAALADSLAVRVKDQYGNGVPGVDVAWSVVRGDGAVSPAMSTTRADGVAKTAWTLGLRVDSAHLARATVGTAAVEAQATAGLPAGVVLTRVSGDNQSAPTGSGALPAPWVVRVTTAGGQPIRGAAIRWQGASTDSLTDAAGESRFRATASGNPETRTFTAVLTGTTASATFTYTVTFAVVATVPGTVLDYRAGRLLWRDAGGTLRVRTGSTDQTVADGAGSVIFGWVYPGGAVYINDRQLFDWRGGGAPVALGPVDPPSFLDWSLPLIQLDGSWLAWKTPGSSTVTLRDLAAGTNTAQVTTNAFDVGPNGDLVYSSGSGLVRRRGGTTTILQAGVYPRQIVTDGINVLYIQVEAVDRAVFRVFYRWNDVDGVSRLGSAFNNSVLGVDPLAANAGWSAVSDGQVTTVSPSGTVRRVPLGPRVRDVSPDGEVILDGGRLLLTTSDTPVQIGPATGDTGRAYFDGTTAYTLLGGTVYRAN